MPRHPALHLLWAQLAGLCNWGPSSCICIGAWPIESSLHMITADVGILPIPSPVLLWQAWAAMRRRPRWMGFEHRIPIFWGPSCTLDVNPHWNMGYCFYLHLVTASTYKGGIKQLVPTQTISCSLTDMSLPMLVKKTYAEQRDTKHFFFLSLALTVVTPDV